MPLQTSDQWKLGGDCSMCRMQNYCKKFCGAHVRFIRRKIRQSILAMQMNAAEPVDWAEKPPEESGADPDADR